MNIEGNPIENTRVDRPTSPNRVGLKNIIEILAVTTRLGLTSFGGPIAHLSYFHHEYVRRRKWLDDGSYADLVALCQILPGPASSQVGMAIGAMRGGIPGAVAAWLGFTLPSMLVMIAFALLLAGFNLESTGLIHGLKIVAVAVVAHAVLGMGRNLIPDRNRATIAIVTAGVVLMAQSAGAQVLLILLAGLTGALLYQKIEVPNASRFTVPVNRAVSLISLALFFFLLLLLPVLRQLIPYQELAVFDSFYRAGALVFGGGHVVLPLLEREVVPVGWVSKEMFLAGYGAAQAVPGPLFTFASYLGAVMGGWPVAVLVTVAVFLPSFLLIIGILPFWQTLRRYPEVQGSLMGVNAAVVGLLLAALYDPIWTSSINKPVDFVLAVALFGMLEYWKLPSWVIVITGAAGGILVFLTGN
ncbi:MAG: chromate transporter [Bacillota bacterium]